MRILLFLVIACLLAACSPDPASSQVARVIVRTGSAIDTVYELGADGKALSSVSQSEYSGEVRRVYSYDGSGRLRGVYREDALGRGSSVSIDPAAGGKSLSAGGAATGLSTEYFYSGEGKLDGIIQTDALGNVMSKSVTD